MAVALTFVFAVVAVGLAAWLYLARRRIDTLETRLAAYREGSAYKVLKQEFGAREFEGATAVTYDEITRARTPTEFHRQALNDAIWHCVRQMVDEGALLVERRSETHHDEWRVRARALVDPPSGAAEARFSDLYLPRFQLDEPRFDVEV